MAICIGAFLFITKIELPDVIGGTIDMLAEMIGPIKEKLVPWIQSRPHPIGPTVRHWMNVAMPETMSDMETRYPVVSKSSCRAPAIIKGGVTMATKIASMCCRAAKSVSFKGGLSSRP